MDIISVLNKKRIVYHADGVSDEEILKAENALGLKFAEEYADYLRMYALVVFDAHELTGICKSSRIDVVASTMRERNDNAELSNDMYLIEYVGVENLTIWQRSNGVIYEAEYKQKPHKIFDSLSEYIESL